MNKSLPLILIALVAVSASYCEDIETETELALNPTNEEETAGLEGGMQIFSDFCIHARDYVTGDIKRTSNGLAARVFKLILGSAEEIGQNVVDTGKLAGNRLANQIESPNAAIEAATNDVENIIADGQRRIAEVETQPKSLIQAFIATISATRNAVTQQVSQKIVALRDSFGVMQLVSALNNGCEKANEYEAQLLKDFDLFRSSLVGPQAAISLDKVPCLTSRRVIRVTGICALARAAESPVKKLITSARSATI